jgi:hypothetical protein
MRKSEFERIVDKSFWGLEAEYGFKKVETKFEQHGCTFKFQNTTSEVILNYEIGDEPWLTIADVNDPENKTSLGWLLVDLGIDKPPTPEQAFRPKIVNDGELETIFQRMNKQITEYGANLLKGDFSSLPRLQERAEKYSQECKRYITIHKSKP